MNVTVARSSGFCRGVQNAVDTAMSVPPQNTYLLGELIHNPEVTKQVSERGIKTVADVSEVPDGATLILRSHGVGKSVYAECKARGIKVLDCTCPFVRHIQKIAEEQSAKGKTIVVIGEKQHPEVAGVCGWCSGESVVIDSDDEAAILPLQDKNIAVVAQTT
ncbi:MAG TPA: hypothetical protein H9741_06050, partial [Candidatus Borkfalkia faecipullorum]|nr:hypothetical protein [Candidatus Borkfalkia faecipullorum]